MQIQHVGVIGAGTMGNGIAHVFAKSGYNVVLCDVEQQFLDRGIATITKNLERESREEQDYRRRQGTAIERILLLWNAAKLRAATCCGSGYGETGNQGRGFFRDLDEVLRPEAILASNTSSISITKLGAFTKRPEKVIGMHFFNPVPVMKLVKLFVAWPRRSETFDTVRDLPTKTRKDSGRSERCARLCFATVCLCR